MKHFSRIFACLALFLVSWVFARSQITVVTYDTIHLIQPEYYFDNFNIDDTLISTISIQKSEAVQLKDAHFKTGGNIFGGVMTAATGIGFGSAADVNWYLPSSIRTNNPKLDWTYNLYCPGYIEKDRTRVKNDDGSKSVEINYLQKFSWQKGAMAFIIESGDTVGWNQIYRNPRIDTAVRIYFQQVYNGNQEHPGINYDDFALIGELAGKKFGVLFNPTDNRFYVLNGNELTGIYHCQKPPEFRLSKKKRKPNDQPYLLVNDKLTASEQMDVLRLVMVGLRMKKAIESY